MNGRVGSVKMMESDDATVRCDARSVSWVLGRWSWSGSGSGSDMGV